MRHRTRVRIATLQGERLAGAIQCVGEALSSIGVST